MPDDVTITAPASRFGSRKFIVAVFLLLAPFGLRIAGLMTEAGLLTIWGLVAGAYFTANVAQKATTK